MINNIEGLNEWEFDSKPKVVLVSKKRQLGAVGISAFKVTTKARELAAAEGFSKKKGPSYNDKHLEAAKKFYLQKEEFEQMNIKESISNMLDQLTSDDVESASDSFREVINAKISERLENLKVDVAASMFGDNVNEEIGDQGEMPDEGDDLPDEGEE